MSPRSDSASIVCVAIVPVAGAVLYLLLDNWWVNWDGGFYLYIARSIWDGGGPSFPDGSPATFRGPGYPGLFAVGWSLFDVSAKTAIWLSRGVLLAGGAIVAGIVARKASAIGAVLAGLTALVPALILESGGWYFVPDGVAAVLVLSAIVVAVWPDDPPRVVAGLVAGGLMAAAVLTKETALLYSPIVPLVILSRTGRGVSDAPRAIGSYLMSLSIILGSWLWWAMSATTMVLPLPTSWAALTLLVLAAVGGGLVAASAPLSRFTSRAPAWLIALVGFPTMMLMAALSLVLLGEPTVLSATDALGRLGGALVYFLGWAWVPAIGVVGLAASLARRIPGRTAPLWLAGVLLLGVGLGQMWYSAAAALSPRNGVGAVIGLAVVAGTSVWASQRRLTRILMVAALGLFLVLAGLVTARIDATSNFEGENWDNGAVVELRSWLSGSSLDSVTITPLYATYLYFLEPSLPEPELLPWHFGSSRADSRGEQSFCRQIWWAADTADCPEDSPARVIQGNRRVLGALFADGREAGLLVVTGSNGSSSAFNGTGLLYLIEKYDLGEPLFATSEAHLPHWAVVYDFDWERWNSDSIPTVVQRDITGLDGLVDDSIPFDREEFVDLLADVLPP